MHKLHIQDKDERRLLLISCPQVFPRVLQASFQRSLAQQDGMALELLVALSRRVRGLTREVKSFALEGGYGRVMKGLSDGGYIMVSKRQIVIQARLPRNW